MDGIDVNIARWTVVSQLELKWREQRRQLREESTQCRGSLSGMDYRDVKAGPGLEVGQGLGRSQECGRPRTDTKRSFCGPQVSRRKHWGNQTDSYLQETWEHARVASYENLSTLLKLYFTSIFRFFTCFFALNNIWLQNMFLHPPSYTTWVPLCMFMFLFSNLT